MIPPNPPEARPPTKAELTYWTSLRSLAAPGPETLATVYRVAFPTLLEHTDRQARDLERLKAALAKISAIRDSIIGLQKINWSEHIYPLVAALDEAGYPGAGYEISRKNVGTLIEQINTAEAELHAARERIAAVETWARYYAHPRRGLGANLYCDPPLTISAARQLLRMLAIPKTPAASESEEP
jgi:hypothetical protein